MNREKFERLYKGKYVHCPTRQSAKEFLELAYEYGFKWNYSENEEAHLWKENKEDTAYHLWVDYTISYISAKGNKGCVEFKTEPKKVLKKKKATYAKAIKETKTTREQVEEIKEEVCNYCKCTDYGSEKINTNQYNQCEGTWCSEALTEYKEDKEFDKEQKKEENNMTSITRLAKDREIEDINRRYNISVAEVKAEDTTHIKITKALKAIERATGNKKVEVIIRNTEVTSHLYGSHLDAKVFLSKATEERLDKLGEDRELELDLINGKYNEIDTVINAMEYADQKKILISYGILNEKGQMN